MDISLDAPTIIKLIVIGIAAGMLSGLVGVGGGIVIVPALVYLLAFSQKEAQGTSLGVLVLPVVFLAAFYYYKAGNVNTKVVPVIAIGFIVGGFLGSKIALAMPEQTVKRIFAVVMILIAFKMLFLDKPKQNSTQTTQLSTENPEK